MSINFTIASSQRLANSGSILPTTGVPITLACWFYPTSIAVTSMVFGLYASAAAATCQKIWQLNTAIAASSNTAGTQVNASAAIALVANRWYFVIARFITITNRWISALDSVTGATSHVQNTTSNSPTALNTLGIGGSASSTPNEFFGGNIAECWYCDADIQRGRTAATALDNNLFLSLAYNGPFFFPDISDKLVEYRSLRMTDPYTASGSIINSFADGDVYYRPGRAAAGWIPTGSPITSFHPPLGTTYLRPNQNKTLVMI